MVSTFITPKRTFGLLLCLMSALTASGQAVQAQCARPAFNSASADVGSNYSAIYSGDLNLDGNADLILSGFNLKVLPGNGTGGFNIPINISGGGRPQFADFNSDGYPDMVSPESVGSFRIRLNNGNGNFGASTIYFTGNEGDTSLAIGDINQDGKRDLVVASYGSESQTPGIVTLWLGTGTGTFTLFATFHNGAHPINPTLGDFNNDGKLDLVIGMGLNALDPPPAPASLRFGNGMGGFSTPVNIPQAASTNIRALDLNGDNRTDLITFSGLYAFVQLSNGDGSFSASVRYTIADAPPNAVTFGDYNGDGKTDMAATIAHELTILFGSGTGRFGLPFEFSVAGSPSSTSADFNNDGKSDIAIISGTNVQIMTTICATSPRNFPFDFDGDSRTDLSVFTVSNGLWKIRNTGNGFELSQFWGLGTDRLVPADYDADTRTDLAVFRPGDGNWYLLESSTNTIRVVHWGASGDIPTPADYDGDSKADIAVWRPGDGNWYVLKSTNNSLLAQHWGSGSSGDKPVMGDYDGDGKSDFAVMRPGSGGASNIWYVLRSSDNSFFAQAWGINTDIAVQGDYDGDAKSDIAVHRQSNGAWFVLQSQTNSARTFQFAPGLDLHPAPGDFDGDGKFDVGVYSRGVSPGDPIRWYYHRSTSGTTVEHVFGNGLGDNPVPAAFIP